VNAGLLWIFPVRVLVMTVVSCVAVIRPSVACWLEPVPRPRGPAAARAPYEASRPHDALDRLCRATAVMVS